MSVYSIAAVMIFIYTIFVMKNKTEIKVQKKSRSEKIFSETSYSSQSSIGYIFNSNFDSISTIDNVNCLSFSIIISKK